jgi:hypothetical protein
VLAVLRHLPQAEGAAADAHVGVDAHEDDIVDVLRLQEVPNFDAAVADGVLGLVDAQRVDLLRPRRAWIETLGGKFLRPRGMFGGIIVLAAVGLIERIDSHLLGGNLLAPFADLVRQTSGGGRGLRALACRCAFIRLHAGTRRMYDQHAVLAGLFEHFIETRSHLTFTRDGVLAVMQIPHVADDDGGARGKPLLFDQGGLVGGRTRLKRECERRFGSEAGNDEGEEECECLHDYCESFLCSSWTLVAMRSSTSSAHPAAAS